jgi:hypothetical protein
LPVRQEPNQQHTHFYGLLAGLPGLPISEGSFNMRRLPSLFAALALATSMACPAVAQQPTHPKVGTLTCDISAGIGFIIGSQKQVTCMFTPAQGGPAEVYVGSISKFGLDIGATAGGEMVWSVYAPTSGRIAALAGNYTGASAEATVGLGLGANVLVGGSDRTVTLQPLSVQGQAGLNLAVGVAGLELRPAR